MVYDKKKETKRFFCAFTGLATTFKLKKKFFSNEKKQTEHREEEFVNRPQKRNLKIAEISFEKTKN